MNNKYLKTGIKALVKLNKRSYTAYIVGGFVRDFLLGLESTDVDITTLATPDTISSIFEKTYPIGIEFGTVLVVIDDVEIEITTFRHDIVYPKNSRKPEVKFSKSIEDDLVRRDFTINALCMDANGCIIDYVNGLNDLNNKLIRCIGNPSVRFKEDPLRKLRAIRFATKLDFEIHPATLAEIYQNPTLSGVSTERKKSELDKIFASKKPSKAIDLLFDCGLIYEFFKGVKVNQKNCRYNNNVEVVFGYLKLIDLINDNILLRYALTIRLALWSFRLELNDEEILELIKSLKFSNKDANKLQKLIIYAETKPRLTKENVVKWIADAKPENLDDLLILYKNIEALDNEKIAYYNQLITIIENLNENEKVYTTKDLDIKASYLISNLEIKEQDKKYISKILDSLLTFVHSDLTRNNQATLLHEASRLLKKYRENK